MTADHNIGAYTVCKIHPVIQGYLTVIFSGKIHFHIIISEQFLLHRQSRYKVYFLLRKIILVFRTVLGIIKPCSAMSRVYDYNNLISCIYFYRHNNDRY